MKKLALPIFLLAAVFAAFAFSPTYSTANQTVEAVMAGCCGVINATPSGFCSGTQTYILNNETAGTSVAYTPGDEVELDPTAKYSITVTSSGSCALTIDYYLCGNTASEPVTVSPNNPATVSLVQGSGPFCF